MTKTTHMRGRGSVSHRGTMMPTSKTTRTTGTSSVSAAGATESTSATTGAATTRTWHIHSSFMFFIHSIILSEKNKQQFMNTLPFIIPQFSPCFLQVYHV